MPRPAAAATFKSRSRRLSDCFREAARRCRSFVGLAALIEDAALELGFRHFALLHHASLGAGTGRAGGGRLVRLDNYPPGWTEEFLARNFVRCDPVHLASRRTSRAFAWSELGRLLRLGPEQREILRQSRRFGLGAGFTVPVNVPGEPGGSCSFAMCSGADLVPERLLCAELVGIHAFDAARRLAADRGQPARPHLSIRQLQCLELLAAGKTDWEISRILGIGHETVRQYVKAARSAYGAVNRTQLAVLALRDDRIRFEDLPLA